jgi:hypothetical protein
MNISEITMSLLMVALFLLIIMLIGILIICIKYHLFGKSADRVLHLAAPPVRLANAQRAAPLVQSANVQLAAPPVQLANVETAAPLQMPMTGQSHFVPVQMPRNQPTRTTNWDANRRSYIK